MTQEQYEEELEDYIAHNIDSGLQAFEDDYLGTLKKVRNHMGMVLRKQYASDVQKLKSISGKNGENTKRLNNWLIKNNLVPTIHN